MTTSRRVWMLALAAVLGSTAAWADDDADLAARSRALERAQAAVVGVRTVAVEDARSAATLGPMRLGSGVVIDRDGLVLTIGYLVLEAEQVQLVIDAHRTIPARVLGYDVASGFGLVQALVPLGIEPAPLGRARQLGIHAEPLMVASGGEDSIVSAVELVSRRAFSGYWEYHVDGALFTTPARRDHSGAGLFNSAGELVGVGSLVVSDAGGSGTRLPGNMFVPIDLLPPILDELRVTGSSKLSQRAWLGINCVEHNGGLLVVRVSDDSPADVAGLKIGDTIVGIDGTEVKALDKLWHTLWDGGAPEREVRLEIRRDDERKIVKVFSVDRMKTLKRAQGI